VQDGVLDFLNGAHGGKLSWAVIVGKSGLGLLTARMVPPAGVLEAVDGEAQVTLGRRQAFVPEQFLDVAHVGPVLQQVGGAGMPPKCGVTFFFIPACFAQQTTMAALEVGDEVKPCFASFRRRKGGNSDGLNKGQV